MTLNYIVMYHMTCCFLLFFFFMGNANCQIKDQLLFREDWKEIPAEVPVSQKHINTASLVLNTHGPGQDSLKKSHHEQPKDDPYYLWSGLCNGNWAVSFKHKHYYIDLSNRSSIKWRTKQFGFRNLHIILKLADGTWLVSEQADGASGDWRVREFNIGDLTWRILDIEKIIEGSRILNPDLGKIDEIGFTDLMRGGKSTACSRLDWIEIYGKKIKR